MAKTPEGERKAEIDKILDAPDIYSFMPVQMGYGRAGLDYHCCMTVRGVAIAFFIEAKKLDGRPSKRQVELIAKLRQLRAKVFVIDTWAGVKEFESWITRLRARNSSSPTPSI